MNIIEKVTAKRRKRNVLNSHINILWETDERPSSFEKSPCQPTRDFIFCFFYIIWWFHYIHRLLVLEANIAIFLLNSQFRNLLTRVVSVLFFALWYFSFHQKFFVGCWTSSSYFSPLPPLMSLEGKKWNEKGDAVTRIIVFFKTTRNSMYLSFEGLQCWWRNNSWVVLYFSFRVDTHWRSVARMTLLALSAIYFFFTCTYIFVHSRLSACALFPFFFSYSSVNIRCRFKTASLYVCLQLINKDRKKRMKKTIV